MPHPDGGRGNLFQTNHTFHEAHDFVENHGQVTFQSTTGETIIATASQAQDQITLTIVFNGENSRHGNVCQACWNFRLNCSGTRIGQCTEGLDRIIP